MANLSRIEFIVFIKVVLKVCSLDAGRILKINKNFLGWRF